MLFALKIAADFSSAVDTLHILHQENKALKEAIIKLMDQLVMMKILLDNCNS